MENLLSTQIHFTVPEDSKPHTGIITKVYQPGKYVVLDLTAKQSGEAQPSRFVFQPQIVCKLDN